MNEESKVFENFIKDQLKPKGKSSFKLFLNQHVKLWFEKFPGYFTFTNQNGALDDAQIKFYNIAVSKILVADLLESC